MTRVLLFRGTARKLDSADTAAAVCTSGTHRGITTASFTRGRTLIDTGFAVSRSERGAGCYMQSESAGGRGALYLSTNLVSLAVTL